MSADQICKGYQIIKGNEKQKLFQQGYFYVPKDEFRKLYLSQAKNLISVINAITATLG